MSSVRLSNTSYAVFGLLERCQPATPYQLKQIAQASILHFWSIPHTQIYTECARLAEAGLLAEEREHGGRRRRTYRLTTSGQHALERWRSEPDGDGYELRDPGLLKLFCGAAPELVAGQQLEWHQRRTAIYEQLAESQSEMSRGMRLALEAGLAHEREYVRFWRSVLENDP